MPTNAAIAHLDWGKLDSVPKNEENIRLTTEDFKDEFGRKGEVGWGESDWNDGRRFEGGNDDELGWKEGLKDGVTVTSLVRDALLLSV